jgi:hypothetical protein
MFSRATWASGLAALKTMEKLHKRGDKCLPAKPLTRTPRYPQGTGRSMT